MKYKLTIGQLLGLIAMILHFYAYLIWRNIIFGFLDQLDSYRIIAPLFICGNISSEICAWKTIEIKLMIFVTTTYLHSLLTSFTRITVFYIIIITFAWLIPWFVPRKIFTLPVGWYFYFSNSLPLSEISAIKRFIGYQVDITGEALFPILQNSIDQYLNILLIANILFTCGWVLDWKKLAILSST
ncbi:MAG: hypothetical protein ACFFDT_04215 [Candidatus Hodarchaeota archaeon]